nr:polymer-forming cytoskeletal protein [uncultured Oscillibacter sp.]
MKPSKKQTRTMEVHMEAADTARGQFSQPPETSNETIIAKGTAVSGHLCGGGMLRVEGTIEGAVEITGVVVVTVTGVVKGPIHADTVYVAGCVEGNVFAKDLLQLEMTGDLNGNIMTASFLIYDGGQLNGCCTMTGAGQEPVFLY